MSPFHADSEYRFAVVQYVPWESTDNRDHNEAYIKLRAKKYAEKHFRNYWWTYPYDWDVMHAAETRSSWTSK